MDKNELLDTATLSVELGMPARTLDMWRHRRVGPPYIKVGHAVRYRRGDVDKWLAERTVTPVVAS